MYDTMQVILSQLLWLSKQRYWKLPCTKAPTIFVPEGVFKGLENVKSYFDMEVRDYESEVSTGSNLA